MPALLRACLQLGADEVVDYTQQRFEEVYRERPFDAVLDAYGQGDYEQRRCAPHGRAHAHSTLHTAGTGSPPGAAPLLPP